MQETQETNQELQALAESESVVKDGDLSGIRPDMVRIGLILVVAIVLFFIIKAAWSSSMKMNMPFIVFLIGLVSMFLIVAVFVIGV